jgi:hypothetical protein
MTKKCGVDLKLRQLDEGNHLPKFLCYHTSPAIEAKTVILLAALYNHSPSNCKLNIQAQQLFTNFTNSKHGDSIEPTWQTHP